MERLEPSFEALWSVLEESLEGPGASWRRLGASWERLGGVLEGVLGASWAVLVAFKVVLDVKMSFESVQDPKY